MTDIEILELFNERAARIGRLTRFIDSLQSERLVSIKIDANGKAKTEKLPDEESLSAAILTLRMFIQNNEPISLYNMSELYSRINVPQDLKDKFNELRDALNCYLDKSSNVTISDTSLGYGKISESESGQQHTNRKLIDAYIYGHYAHCDKSKRKDFKKIDTVPIFGPLGKFHFTSILKRIILVINETTSVNQEAIQYLDETSFWQQVSQESLSKVWDNTEDDVYAELL